MSIEENIARAKALVRRANKRDRVSVLEVLEQARVYINGFLKGDFSHDAERMIYLEFVEKALGKIVSGKKPQVALFMDNENRPQSLSSLDFLTWAYAVGKTYEQIEPKRVYRAIEIVAEKNKVSISTVKQAWLKFGGLKHWENEKKEHLKSGEVKIYEYDYRKPDCDEPRRGAIRKKRRVHKMAQRKKNQLRKKELKKTN